MHYDNVDTLIIGAGAAGLAAFRELHQASVHVSCIEALDRIGGRICTVHDPLSPLAIELGAEFVHGKPPQVWDLVTANALPIVERVHEIHYPENPNQDRDDGMWRLLSAMEKAAEKGPDESFQSFAARSDFDKAAKHAATSYVEGFNAARSEIIGIHSLAEDSKAAEAIDGDRSFHLFQGYDAVARALLPAFARLHLNTVAERIEWKPGEVTVHVRSTLDGSSGKIEARRLIVTVSLGVLQANAIEFSPQPEPLAAARELAFGQVMRVTLRFERTPDFLRPGFLLSDEPVFPTWWTTLPVHAPVITGWSAGPKAEPLLGQSKTAIVGRAMDSLRRIVRAELPPLAAAYFHDWQTDPFFRGAYSYVPAGKLGARTKLAQPVAGTLYFAGEAANLSGHSATVHGAIESGVNAARSAIAHARGRSDVIQRA